MAVNDRNAPARQVQRTASAPAGAYRQTLEQLRAADAWHCSQGCSEAYQNLAKGLPALIMNSGLLQVLAYLEHKGAKSTQRDHAVLGNHLRQWLTARFPADLPDAAFKPFMSALMAAEPRTFQLVTTEAFAWLRWVRQIAPAVGVEG